MAVQVSKREKKKSVQVNEEVGRFQFGKFGRRLIVATNSVGYHFKLREKFVSKIELSKINDLYVGAMYFGQVNYSLA